MKSVRDLQVGESAVISNVKGEGALRRRLLDMGLTKGTRLTIRKVAPLGDPLEIAVRSYELSIRKKDAEWIEVEESND